MKIDVSGLKYEEIERVLADLPFQVRQLTSVGGRVVLDCAGTAGNLRFPHNSSGELWGSQVREGLVSSPV